MMQDDVRLAASLQGRPGRSRLFTPPTSNATGRFLLTQEATMKKQVAAIALLAIFGGATQANAIGCVSGAVAGGIAGHYAGHHAVLGALGGCVAGHELHKKQVADKKLKQQQMDNEIKHAEPAPVPPAPMPTQAQ
jgi:hypothetical protein